MEEKPGTRTATQIAVNLFVTFCLVIIGLFMIPQISWVRSNTNISINGLFGLLALMGGIIAILRIRKSFLFSNVLLYSAFIFLGILHLMAAVFLILGFIPPGSTILSFRFVASILEFTIFIGLLVSSLFLKLFYDIPITKKDSRTYGPIIITSCLTSYAFNYILILPLLSAPLLNALGFYLTCASVGMLLSAIYFVSRAKNLQKSYDHFWVLNGFIQFLFVTPIYFISLVFSLQIWLIATLFTTFGLVSLNLTVSIPQIHSTGMNEKNAFRYALILNLFIIIPFLTAFFLEYFYSIPLISYELYSLIRSCAAIISLGIALLIYMYSKQKFTRSFIPLMLAFVTWILVDILLLFFGPFFPFYSESLIPYIVGYIMVLLLLITAVYWKQNPPQVKRTGLPRIRIWLSIVAIMFALIISISIENWLLFTNPGIFFSPADRIILLCFSFLNVIWFTILGYFYLQESHGEVTIEILGLSFLMLWIIPGILKSIFRMWEWGWWAAELLMLGGLMIAPIIFGISYLQALKTTEDAEKRATLYADILAHDISNYHQAILTSLELIELDDVPEKIHEQAMDQIHMSLSRADHLIKNVRRLGKVERMPVTTFQPLDLVTHVYLAFDQVRRALGDSEFRLECNQNEGNCYVDSNLLLVDLFQNLIRNAMEYSSTQKKIEVNIKLLHNRDQLWWEIQVIDFGRGIPPERKAQLFNRYMDGAHGSGLGLSVVRALAEAFGGWVSVQDRIPNEYQKGTVFLVYLPVSTSKPPKTSLISR